MKTHVALAALVLAGAVPGTAQQAVMKSTEKPLTLEQAQAQKGIMLLRDSLVAAGSALRQLQRDYEKVSARTLEGWARQVADRCAGAERTAPVARALVGGGTFIPTEMARAQKSMVEEIDRTTNALKSCQSTFRPLAEPGKGEEVRGYGNRRAEPLLQQFRKFDAAAHRTALALDLDVREVFKAGKAPL